MLEGAATLSNLREMRKRRGAKPLTRYLRETKDSDLVVVFGENLAATVGLALALAALLLAHTTGEPRWDGAGSLAIGIVLVAVAFFLAIEVKGLLLGEAGDSEIEAAARESAHNHPNLGELVTIITVQQGPGEVVAMLKVTARLELTARQISDAVNDYEKALRERRPEVKWSFIEVELERDHAVVGIEQREAG